MKIIRSYLCVGSALVLGRLWVGFGSALGWCWVVLGLVLNWFWIAFESGLNLFWVGSGSILDTFWGRFQLELKPSGTRPQDSNIFHIYIYIYVQRFLEQPGAPELQSFVANMPPKTPYSRSKPLVRST